MPSDWGQSLYNVSNDWGQSLYNVRSPARWPSALAMVPTRNWAFPLQDGSTPTDREPPPDTDIRQSVPATQQPLVARHSLPSAAANWAKRAPSCLPKSPARSSFPIMKMLASAEVIR